MKLLDDLKKPVPTTLPEGKDRTVYLILAIFLGAWGIHNFWAGGEFAEKGKSQLIVGLGVNCCCCLLGIPGLLSWISAIKDATSIK